MANLNAPSPRKGLFGALFSRHSTADPIVQDMPIPSVAVEAELASLRSQVKRLQEDQDGFAVNEPYWPANEMLSGLIAPYPGAGQRRRSGSPSMLASLLGCDAWQILLSRFLKPNSLLLDVGGDAGMTARSLAFHGFIRRYICADLSEESVTFGLRELTPRIGSKLEFHHLDLTSRVDEGSHLLPALDGSVDLAWAPILFARIPEDQARRLLRDVRRTLAPSGVFLAAFASHPAPGQRYSYNHARYDVDVDHFAAMCDEAGLDVVARLGEVLDRCVMQLKPKPAPATPEIVNVGGAKTEDELAEAARRRDGGSPLPAGLGVLSKEMLRLNEQWARHVEVPADVHPEDFIYWFVTNHPDRSLEDAIRYYFEDGARSAAKLDGHLSRLFVSDKGPIKLLEFASGYGCVSRHLKKNPRFDLTSCDIHPQAIDFLRSRLGVRALQSAHTPEDFAAPDKYDAIFCLSFFSHMPKSTFGRWIKALYNSLRPGGYLLFTAHGAHSYEGLRITPEHADEEGFWFQATSEQHDLDGAEYGVTLSLPQYVIPTVYRAVAAPIADFRPGEWWNHQDLWAVKRDR